MVISGDVASQAMASDDAQARGLRSGSIYLLQYRSPADAAWRWLGTCLNDTGRVCTLAQSN